MGARLVAFSPDSRWLSVVASDSEVHVARLEEAKQPNYLATAVELERATRKNTKQTGLKKYERTITKLAFSPDSAVLVASDLSGYLDSWVLEGHYDETAPSTLTAKSLQSTSSEDDDASSDSDSDSDDDDEETIFYAQHWAENPSANLLPKLDSAPLLLSFRPFASKPTEPVHGNPGLRATRNNPNAYSHALPNTKSPLFIVTAHHQVYEFDVLAGKLTDWSRRNPTSVLPAELQTIKDRVMGAVWDVDESGARTWLYGSNWVGMLDLTQNHHRAQGDEDALEDGDVVSDLQTPAKKRKRSESGKWNKIAEQRKKTKGASGAGDKVPSTERNGVPEEIKRIEDGKVVDEAAHIDGVDDDDEEDEDAVVDESAVGPLRRGDTEEDMDVDGIPGSKDQRRKWWCTYRYRPILGMMPIGEKQGEGSETESILIERPLWDLPHLKELGKA